MKAIRYFSQISQIIKEAVRLDIHDLSYTFTGENFQYTILAKASLPKPGIFFRIGVFLIRWVYSLRDLPKYRDLFYDKTHPLLFFATSRNQQNSLQTIFEESSQARFLGLKGFGVERLPLFTAYTLSSFFLPIVLFQYWRASGDTKKSYRYFFDLYWLSYGYYITARWFFHKMEPSGLVMANDHIMWTRTLLLAARREAIPSMYIQHASVTERFPPLSFDYAFLEGIDATEKYASKGNSHTQVYLVGMASFDKHYGMINQSDHVSALGICTNLFETFNLVEELAIQFKESIPTLKCILRPHPADSRKSDWLTMAKQFGWEYSNSEEENIFGFLNRVDAILAGDSNVHLEAALLNVYPVYFDFSKKKMDWYGFHRNGLVVYCDDTREGTKLLKSLMKKKPDVRHLTHRYCETVGTRYDGASTKLITSLIQSIISPSNQSVNEEWVQSAHFDNLLVYRPK